MRRAPLLSVVAALSLAACAGRTPVPGAHPALPEEPLAVRLFQPSGREISFALNRPAYVAVFEVVPGQGVSLLYPAEYQYAATHPSSAGINVATLPPYNLGRMFYFASFANSGQPTYLYAIASETPLAIADIMSRPSALRSRIGALAFAQGFSQDLMDRLDETVVPAQPDESWDSDFFVLWAEPGTGPRRDTGAPTLIYVVCGDGRLIAVNALTGERYGQCLEPRRVVPAPTDSTGKPPRPPGPPVDSASPRPLPGAPTTPRGATPPQQRKSEGMAARLAAPTSLVVDYAEYRPAAATASDPASRRRRAESHPGWRGGDDRASLAGREGERPADRERRVAERASATARDADAARSGAASASASATAPESRGNTPRSAPARQQ